MKKTFYLLVISVLLLACKNSGSSGETESGDNQPSTEAQLDALDKISEEQQKELENAYFYVMVPSGLSLRKSDQLDSEKLTTMPLGSKVKQTSAMYTIDMTVENIPGSMMEVTYKEQMGYAFSGYLSAFPMPAKDVEPEDYVKSLKERFPVASFSQKRTPEDFHEGFINQVTLPTVHWHEAYYVAMALYHIPKSFSFPSEKGLEQEVISEKKPEEGTWSSDLVVNRKNNNFDTINYNYRAEGFGFRVELTKGENDLIHIEYLTFVD